MQRAAYTAQEVADMIGVSVDTVYRMIASGLLASFRIGTRRLRIPAHALTALGIQEAQ